MSLESELSWSLLELIDRYAHIYDFKESVKYQIHPDSKNFLQHVEGQIEDTLNEVKVVINSIIEGRQTTEYSEDWMKIDNEEILKKSWIIRLKQETILPALMSLSFPRPRPEVKYFLEEVYNMEPNISFEPVYNYNYVDYTYKRVERYEGTLVMLPIISVCSPELWVGLAHEAAHLNRPLVNKFVATSIKYVDTTSDITETELKNWLEEIVCDLFALRTIGPCYYLSFTLLAILESVYNPLITPPYYYSVQGSDVMAGETEHPLHSVRIEIMKSFIDDYISNSIFKDLCDELHDCYILIKGMEDEHLERLSDDISKEIIDKIKVETDVLTSCKSELNTILNEAIESFNNKFNPMSNDKLALSCKLANEVINNRVPVGVYREEDGARIIEEVNKLKSLLDISKEEFSKLFDMLQETPVEIPVLFNTFQLVKIKQMEELYRAFNEANENETDFIKLYVGDTVLRNELFLKSIEMSKIFKFYRGDNH